MKTNTYIAAILAFLFLAKLVVNDGNGLNILLGGNDITFVKLNCKKKNATKLSNKTLDFSQADLMTSQEVFLSGFCTSQFKFELFSLTTTISQPMIVFNDYFTSNLSYRFLENVSPPPRLS